MIPIEHDDALDMNANTYCSPLLIALVYLDTSQSYMVGMYYASTIIGMNCIAIEMTELTRSVNYICINNVQCCKLFLTYQVELIQHYHGNMSDCNCMVHMSATCILHS